MRSLLALAVFLPSIAAAETKVTVGATAGLWQNKQDAQDGADSIHTLGLYGRVGLSKRLSAQLEITRHQSQEGCATCTFGTETDIRVFSGLLVVDLTDGGRWVPTLMAGVGIDRDDGSFPTSGTHIEGGFGLEYRADGGLTIGADARLGGRSINSEVIAEPATDLRFFGPTAMREGEYRAIRLTLGVRF
jgi:hypothetical protein